MVAHLRKRHVLLEAFWELQPKFIEVGGRDPGGAGEDLQCLGFF